MKKKPLLLDSESYEGVRLFRDDIDSIILELENENYKIEISDKEFVYTTIDELKNKHGEKPNYFQIEAKFKGNIYDQLNIFFEKKYIHLFSLGENSSKYPFGKIRDILESKYSKLYKILNPWFYVFPTIILTIYLPKEKQISEIPLWLSLLTLLITTVWIISVLYRFTTPQVVLTYRHEGGFWKRNRDKIILIIISGIFTALLALLTNFLSKLI